MNLPQIQDAIEERLATAGFSCDPGVLNLTMKIKKLPCAAAYFVGFAETPEETDTDTFVARFRVDLIFSLMDAQAFRDQLLTGVSAFYAQIRTDRSLGGLVDTTTVSDGGIPEFTETTIPAAVKMLFVEVEFEEDA